LRSVMYVPPIMGSETLAWNAPIQINCVVLAISPILRNSIRNMKKASRDRGRGKIPQDDGGEGRERKTRPIRPDPRTQRAIPARPTCDEIAEYDLDGKVGQDRHREILFSESLFDHFKRRRGVVGRKADLGDEVKEQEGPDAF